MATTIQKKLEIIEAALQNPYVQAAAEMVADAELGTAARNGGGYNVAFGGKRFTDMSQFPKDARGVYTDKQGRKRVSEDAGRYQFNRTTADALMKRYGFKDFSKESQDRMFVALLLESGTLKDIMAGNIDKAMPRLGRIWHSLPSSKAGAAAHNVYSYGHVYSTYNNALQERVGDAAVRYMDVPKGDGTWLRQETVPQISSNVPITSSSTTSIPVIPTPTKLDVKFDTQASTPDGYKYGQWSNHPSVAAIRESLAQRYANRRLLATTPGPLTTEAQSTLAGALTNPDNTVSRHPFPYPHNPQGATLTQYPVPGQAMASTGVSVPTVSPDSVDDVKFTVTPSGVVAPMSQREPSIAPFVDNQGPLDPIQFPIAPPSPIVAESTPTFTVAPLYDEAIAGLLGGADSLATETVASLSPIQYLEQQLRIANKLDTVDDFLKVAALDTPYNQELLELIDKTPVNLG